MQSFEIFKIQNKIEEKRLILGKKIEKFFLKKLKKLQKFSYLIANSKNFTPISSCLIIALSLFIQSSRDIGHSSAYYLEVAQKMFEGGKYYQDFFSINLPLSFWLILIPVFLANILDISPIFSCVIFVNLLAILSLICFKNIVKKRLSPQWRQSFNFTIFIFSSLLFLAPATLYFNNFFTENAFFLIFLLPYFAYQLLEKPTKSQQIISAILAGLIFCLKANYLIVILLFELQKFFKKNHSDKLFLLRNGVTFAVIAIYFLAIFLFQGHYFSNFSVILQNNFNSFSSASPVIIREDIFPILLFFALAFPLLKKNFLLRQFYLLLLAAILIVILQGQGHLDQRFIIHSLALPALAVNIFYLIREGYFDLKKYWMALFAFGLIAQFDSYNIFNLLLDICSFWFVFVIIFYFKNKKTYSAKNKRKKIYLPDSIFALSNNNSRVIFVLLSALTILLNFYQHTFFIAWLIAAILFIYFAIFAQRTYRDNLAKKRLSFFSTLIITLVFSYFISAQISAILNVTSFHQLAASYKSPNFSNEQIIKFTKKYAGKKSILIVSNEIQDAYPALIYLNKKNHFPNSQMTSLFRRITRPNQEYLAGEKYLLESLKEQLSNKNNKLLFVKNFTKQCQISFLEYYLRDAQFRKIFLKNYRFLNRIIATKNSQNEVSFYKNDFDQIDQKTSNKITQDIEVYVRK